MADNIAITAGSGTTIATEDEGGVHYQKVKLTASGTGVTQDLTKAEDAAHSTGDHGIMALAVRQDTAAALSGTDGDYQPLITDANGRLHVLDQNSAAILADTANMDTNITAILADTANMDTNLGTVAGAVAGTEMQVDVVGSLPAGTNAIGKLAANSGVDIGDVDVLSLPASTNTLEVVGDVAHDAAAAGNPVAIAGRATNNIEGLTQVAAADASFVTTDLNGVLVTRPHTTLEEIISERVSDTSGTSTAFTNFAAGGAGVHNYITTIAIWNSSATDGYVDFRDGAAGSILFTAPAPTVGGSVINLPVPLKTSANTALAYDVSGALSTVYISVVGFQAQG